MPGWPDTGGTMKKVSVTADTLVVTGPCVYWGHVVTTAMSAAVTDIRDSVAAGAGDKIDSIVASAAIGSRSQPAAGYPCSTGLFIDFGGTGTVTVYYESR